jgi:uncharacterized membrane protein
MNPAIAARLLVLLPIALISCMLPWIGYSRRGVLFGVTVPLDFTSTSEARLALRSFRVSVIALGLAIITIIALMLWFAPSGILVKNAADPLIVVLAVQLELIGTFYLWRRQAERIKPFAVKIPLERHTDLVATSTTAPILLNALSLLPLGVTALWLRLHWNQIPEHWVKHWSLSGAANDFGTRSIDGVFGILIAGAITVLLLVAASIFMTQAAGPQATQRRRALVPMAAFSWLIVGIFCILALRPLVPLTPGRLMLITTIYLTVVIAISLWLIQRSGLAPYSASTEPYDSTPDSKWHAGIFYFNPDDAAVIVPKRFGWGWTLNFARPSAWIYLGAILLVTLSLKVLFK